MTRYVQRSLVLLLVAAPLVFMGCGNSSSSPDAALPKDGAPRAPDVANVSPDASPDLAVVVSPDGAVVPPDAGVDTLAVTPDVGPVITPDAAADRLVPTGDVGPVGTPDAAADTLVAPVDLGLPGSPDVPADKSPATFDVGTVPTPDASADQPAATGDAGLAIKSDAAADGSADAGDATFVVTTDAVAGQADGSAAADSASSVADACAAFTGGPVSSDLTLSKACSPYIISTQIQVNSGAVLTIQPGVTLSFAEVVGLDVGGHTSGKLVAVGTAADPITFTSNGSPPLPGDWKSIHLYGGTMAGTTIAYANVNSCGADRDGCIVGDGLDANLVTLDHLTMSIVDPDADGIVEYDSDSNFAITNSTFNLGDLNPGQYAISVQAPSFAGIGAGNVFNNGVMVEIAGGTVGSTTSWSDPGATIAVTSNLVVDGAGSPVLTLGPGMTIAFAASNPPLEFSIGPSTGGSLVVAGTSTNRVVITSLADLPNQGDWVGVEVWPSGSAQISYANISYGGSDGNGGGNVILESATSTASLALDHTALTYSGGYGVYLPCATATPTATVTFGAGNTYMHNNLDLADANTQATNVGPGFTCSNL